jgi:hypothetical protein
MGNAVGIGTRVTSLSNWLPTVTLPSSSPQNFVQNRKIKNHIIARQFHERFQAKPNPGFDSLIVNHFRVQYPPEFLLTASFNVRYETPFLQSQGKNPYSNSTS